MKKKLNFVYDKEFCYSLFNKSWGVAKITTPTGYAFAMKITLKGENFSFKVLVKRNGKYDVKFTVERLNVKKNIKEEDIDPQRFLEAKKFQKFGENYICIYDEVVSALCPILAMFLTTFKNEEGVDPWEKGRLRRGEIPKDLPEKHGVYLIRDRRSKKCRYVGQTNNLRSRLMTHENTRSRAKGGLWRVKTMFEREYHYVEYKLAEGTIKRSDLLKKEKEYIKKYKPYQNN